MRKAWISARGGLKYLLSIAVIQSIATISVVGDSYVTSSSKSINSESIALWGTLSLFSIFLVGFLSINLEYGYEGRRYNKLIPEEAGLAKVTLVFSSIATGISMAFFVALLTNINVILGGFTSVTLLKTLLMLAAMIIGDLQLGFVYYFSRNATQIIRGDLTMVLMGVLALSMGFALPAALAALQPRRAAEYSNMAGALVGSGLTLIALGLQKYYEKQSHCNSRPKSSITVKAAAG